MRASICCLPSQPCTHLIKLQLSNVCESTPIVLDVLQLDLQVAVMLSMLLSQSQGMVVVACGTAHTDGCLHIKIYFTVLGLLLKCTGTQYVVNLLFTV